AEDGIRDRNVTGVQTCALPILDEAEVWPPPYQPSIRVWHGSATSKDSVDLAVRYGEPIFSANVTHSVEPYQELVEYYRAQWAARSEERRVGKESGWRRET